MLTKWPGGQPGAPAALQQSLWRRAQAKIRTAAPEPPSPFLRRHCCLLSRCFLSSARSGCALDCFYLVIHLLLLWSCIQMNKLFPRLSPRHCSLGLYMSLPPDGVRNFRFHPPSLKARASSQGWSHDFTSFYFKIKQKQINCNEQLCNDFHYKPQPQPKEINTNL